MLSRSLRQIQKAPSNTRSVFTLPKLPWNIEEGLAPVTSSNQLNYHYNFHHKTYVDKANNLIKNTKYEAAKIEDIIVDSGRDSSQALIFNNVAQHWNHSFFWNCMTPGGSEIPETLKQRIINDFGSVDAFKDKFTEFSLSLFGSGWTWLVQNNSGRLSIVNKTNAGNPMVDGRVPLLTCDVWEHAYYLDHQNRRPEYINNWFKVVNWDFVEKNLVNSKAE